MKTSSQDILITKNGLYTNDNQQENDINSVIAGTADNNIKNINDPNYLSPFEKPQLQVQMDNFATIYAADKDIATSEGIDFSAYDVDYQAYLAYMTPLVADMTTYSPIVRSTFNSMVTAVQAEQKRFNTATQAQYNQQIKQAQTDIANGQTKYEALQSDAETMKSSVAGIADAADRAIRNAGFASNTASEASQAASSAVASAMSAESVASSAVSIANSTASEFGKVKQDTNSALAKALDSQRDASDAVKKASSAAADSKDAKQIAGAVSQSYKTLTDGSTMTIAELQSGLAAKLTKTDLNGYATQDWTQNQVKMTADGINGTMSSIKSTVDGQTTSINDLKADSSSFKSQFTKVNNTLGKQTTDIGSLQASSKELTTGFNTLTSDNTTNKNDISQLKQTATEVSSTLETVQTQVQNSAVGTNLLKGTAEFKPWGGDRQFFPNGYLGLTFAFEKDSDGDIAWHLSGTANGSSMVGAYNLQLKHAYPSTYAFSVSVKGTFANTTLNGFYVEDSSNVTNSINWSSNYSRWVATGNVASDNAGAAVLYFNIKSGDTVDIWVKKWKFEKGSLSTDWCPNPADNATVTALSSLSQTVSGLQSTVSDKVSSSQLTQLSNQLTNKISDLSSSTSSQFTQTSKDINGLVKKGDVVNQFNLDAGGALLQTVGGNTKIVFSSPNIIFDSVNPVQIPNVNIPGTLTGKTIDASTITATTKITGSDIEAPLIHSPSGSFKLDGNTGDIIGASIHSADNSWGIDKNGNINGATINTPNLDLGFNGTFTEDFDYTQNTSIFLPKKNKGTLTFNHGVLQSRGNMQTYVSGQWGGINDGIVFQSGIGNSQWTEVAPGYIKLDLFKQNGTDIAERTYTDPTGYYYSLEGNGVTSYLGNVLSTPQVQTGGVLAQYIGPGKGVLRLQIGQNGKDYGLQVGSYAGKEAVLSDFIYGYTTSGEPNIHIDMYGRLARSTSASKYKYNIKNPDIEDTLGDRLLNVHLATWNDKRAVDLYAEQLSTGEEREKTSIDKYYGLIAEQLRDAGLDMFINYGKNHEIEGIKYDRAWVPLLSVIRRLNNKVNEYELRLSKLEGANK